MTTAYTIFKEIGIVLISVGLTWFAAIKVQFAKDEKTAIASAKSFILKLITIFSNSFIAYLLIAEFLSSESLTKKSLFSILIYSFTLFYALVSYHIRELADLGIRMAETARKHLKITEILLNKTEKKKK